MHWLWHSVRSFKIFSFQMFSSPFRTFHTPSNHQVIQELCSSVQLILIDKRCVVSRMADGGMQTEPCSINVDCKLGSRVVS